MSDSTNDYNISIDGDMSITSLTSDAMPSITTTDISTITITGSTATYYVVDDTIDLSGITFTSPHDALEKRLEKLEKIIAEEAELRAKHPAVKQAYDEYKLLATLAKIHDNGLTEE